MKMARAIANQEIDRRMIKLKEEPLKIEPLANYEQVKQIPTQPTQDSAQCDEMM